MKRTSHALLAEKGLRVTGKAGVTFCGRPVFRVYNFILRQHNYETDAGRVMTISDIPTCRGCAKHVKGKTDGQ